MHCELSPTILTFIANSIYPAKSLYHPSFLDSSCQQDWRNNYLSYKIIARIKPGMSGNTLHIGGIWSLILLHNQLLYLKCFCCKLSGDIGNTT